MIHGCTNFVPFFLSVDKFQIITALGFSFLSQETAIQYIACTKEGSLTVGWLVGGLDGWMDGWLDEVDEWAC